MNVSERGTTCSIQKQGYKDLSLDFETFLPIADVLFRLSVNFIVWQPTIINVRKADGTPVSSADKNAQQLVKNVLKMAAPHIPVRGEEDTHTGGPTASSEVYWSVDPIDGTRFYGAMKYEWCVSIALIVGGEPYVGIILQPGRGECFVGIKGKGIQWRTQDKSWTQFVRKRASVPMLVVPTSRSVLCNSVYTAKAVHLTTRFENTFSVPSVLAVLEIVRGHAWGWVSLFRPWHWDIAAAFVLVREIDGVALCANGDPIPFWKQDRFPSVIFAVSNEKAAAIGWVLDETRSSSLV